MLTVGCGGGDSKDLGKSFLQLLDDTTAVLKEIKDEPTARAAEPKLKALSDRKKGLDIEAKATKLSKSEMDASDKKYAGPMEEAANRLRAEMTRIMETSPEAAAIVANVMEPG